MTDAVTYSNGDYVHTRTVDGVTRRVLRWYNRYERSWVVVEVDENGYDEGRASQYVYSKAEALDEVEYIFSQPRLDGLGRPIGSLDMGCRVR